MSDHPTTVDLNGNTLARGYFSGIGEDLAALNASNLATGTVTDARLSTNVALKNGANTWPNPQTFTVPPYLGTIGFTASTVGWYRLTAWDVSTFTQNIRLFATANPPTDAETLFSLDLVGNIFQQYGTPPSLGIIHNQHYGSAGAAITQVRSCQEGFDVYVAQVPCVITVQAGPDPAGVVYSGFAFNPPATESQIYVLPNRGSLTLADLSVTGNLILAAAGNGLQLKEGTNARSGTATLVAGMVTVANTSVTANTRFVLTPHGTTIAAVGISAQTPGISFVIKSASGSDTNHVDWLMWEPAP